MAINSVTTRYETMIRHDEAGQFKGGHHIDITRWVSDAGEPVPPPVMSEAIPLSEEDLRAYLAEDAASALAGFSRVKGQSLSLTALLEAEQERRRLLEGQLIEAQSRSAEQAAEIERLIAALAAAST